MTTEQQVTSKQAKNKGGRPRKQVKGEHLWIPAEFITATKAFLDVLKKTSITKQ